MGKVLFNGAAIESRRRSNPVPGPPDRFVPLAKLPAEQIYRVGDSVWGRGPGSELLRAMDQGTGAAQRFGGRADGTLYRRVLAEARADGNMRFERMEGSSKSGFQIGSFLNEGRQATEQEARDTYAANLRAGLKVYEEVMGRSAPNWEDLGPLQRSAQKDILAHIGCLVLYEPSLIPQLADRKVVGPDLQILTADKSTGGRGYSDFRGALIATQDYDLFVDTSRVPPNPSAEAPGFQPQSYVGFGSQGPDVAEIQRRLGMKQQEDVFDQRTEDEVRKFQSQNHLQPTGIVDPDTWDVLRGARTVTQSRRHDANSQPDMDEGGNRGREAPSVAPLVHV